MVVTPGGTTAAGLAAMEKPGTAEGLIAAVEAATKRGREMAQENRVAGVSTLNVYTSAARITSSGASRPNQISNASAP